MPLYVGNCKFAATYVGVMDDVWPQAPSRPESSSSRRSIPARKVPVPAVLTGVLNHHDATPPASAPGAPSPRRKRLSRQRSRERLHSPSLQHSQFMRLSASRSAASEAQTDEHFAPPPQHFPEAEPNDLSGDGMYDATYEVEMIKPPSPPPVTGELPGRVEWWTPCPALARDGNSARVLSAQTLGWGESRVVAVLLADNGQPNMRLRVYDIRRACWSTTDSIDGETPPRARVGCASCAWTVFESGDPSTSHFCRSSRLLLYGGIDSNGELSDELSCLTLNESLPERERTWSWTVVRVNLSSQAGPGPRAHHAMTAHDSVGYLHGGKMPSGAMSGELWKLQCRGHSREVLASWTICTDSSNVDSLVSSFPFATVGVAPRPRCMHSLCCVANKLMLFGGEGATSKDTLDLGKDFFSFNPATGEWEELANSRPGAKRQGLRRSGHGSCACGPLLVLAGGKNSGYTESNSQGKNDADLRLYDCRDELPMYGDEIRMGSREVVSRMPYGDGMRPASSNRTPNSPCDLSDSRRALPARL